MRYQWHSTDLGRDVYDQLLQSGASLLQCSIGFRPVTFSWTENQVILQKSIKRRLLLSCRQAVWIPQGGSEKWTKVLRKNNRNLKKNEHLCIKGKI